jgi:hypothetical protein
LYASQEKKRKYLKAKINELETNSTNWSIRYLYRTINDFKKGYQLKTNMVSMRRVIWLQTTTAF